MGQREPPSWRQCSNSSLFFIGRNSQGHWVVQDQRHLYGGLFVDRAKALKFALFENGNRPQAVVMVPGLLELDIGGKGLASHEAAANTEVPRPRQAA